MTRVAGERGRAEPGVASTRRAPEATLHGLVERRAERAPDAFAVAADGERLTYRELDARANALAWHLRELGVARGALVGLCLERSEHAVVAILGVLKAGAAFVPLDPRYPPERLSFMLSDARPAVVLCEAYMRDSLPDADARVVLVDDLADARADAGPEAGVGGEDLCYVMYTSGSTGTPKGVLVPHRGIRNRVTWELDAYPPRPSARVLHRTSLSFDISLWEIFVPLAAGAEVVVAASDGHYDPAYLVRLVRDEDVAAIALVPSLLRALLEEDPGLETCASLRDVFCGGEVLTPELQERFFERVDANLHNLYGPTEYSIDATYWACVRGDRRERVPIGRPIANTRAYVLDDDMRRVPAGEPGELYVGGAGLALGYLGRPELTERAFVPDPFVAGERVYRTGDLVCDVGDGVLEFLGRADDQVKIRGFRVELGEIESVARAFPGVDQAVVTARGDGDARKLVAYVVPERGAEPSPSELRSALAQRLPDYMVPAAFVTLDELPLGPTGKLDRAALPDPAPVTGGGGSDPARSDAERRIVEIFADILDVDDVGRDDGFFDLGGNSLQAVRLVNRLRDAFGVDVPLTAVFESPTAAGIARAAGLS